MLEGNTSSAPSIPAVAGDSYSRLHIHPLDSELLKVVVPAAVLSKARNISFHTIETFPENRYGFIELPAADAEKIRKKFNWSTLRGRKMRVEKARPEKIPEAGGGSGDEADGGKKRKKKSSGDREDRESKKQKRDYNTVEGVHLPEGRKVKRGWTATPAEVRKEKRTKSKDKTDKKAKKMAVRSKYTEKEECLVKTVPPPNAPNADDAEAIDKRRKKGKSKREVVAHEFQHTTKFPNFIKASASSLAPEEDKPETPGLLGISNATAASKRQKTTKKPEPEADAESESSSDDSDSSSDGDSSSDEEQVADAVEVKSDSESSDEESDSESESGSTTGGDKAGVMSSPGSARPKSSSLSIQIPPPSTPAAVHPLEALYKKAKKEDNVQAAPAAEPFSFFEKSDDDDEEEEEGRDAPARSSQPPMTPFSKQDFEQRNVRSAAPTPDTAHPSRAARAFWAPSANGGLEEEDESTSPIRRGLDRGDGGGDEAGTEGPAPIGDFHSWFYDNRRDLNRSWMDRRKSARKEKRQRDNRAKGR